MSNIFNKVEKNHIMTNGQIVDSKTENKSKQNVEEIIIAGGEEEVCFFNKHKQIKNY